jgi:deoxyribonuclease-2
LCAAVAAASIGCRDEKGNPVDWFVAFKFNDGMRYAYGDPSTEGTVSMSQYSLDSSSDGAVAHTLQQSYGDGITFARYNDEPPPDKKASSTYVHTKGTLAASGESGFWLVHSCPHFPATGSYGGLADTEEKYAQSFLCVSLSAGQLDAVGDAFFLNRPYVYDSAVTEDIASAAPALAAYLNNGDYSRDAIGNVTDIRTRGGMGMTLFSKTRYWDKDLYGDLVAPTFSSDLLVESWMNGVGPLPSWCKPQYQYNTIDIRALSLAGQSWTETQDHSKWAITTSDYTGDSNSASLRGSTFGSSKSMVCIGDINRQHGQLSRGGGTVCMESPALWKQLTGAITQQDQC